MFPAERRRILLDTVLAAGAASVRELCDRTGASEVTVRRDLQSLEDDGLIVRSRGGALAPPAEAPEPTYATKTQVAAAEKVAIAQRAAALVRDGDSLVIGAGTTTQMFARAIAPRRDLTVVTNSVLVADVLAYAHGVEVVLTGGHLRGPTFSLTGAAAEASLAAIHAEKVFLSGNGLTARRGLSTPNPGVASMDRAIAAAGREVIVLADHTKIGVDALVQTVPTARISTLITDAGTSEADVSALRAAGMTVIMA